MNQNRRILDVKRQQIVFWPSVLSQSVLPASKSIFVLGYTNSGTNWLCQLVSNYFGIPLFEPWKRVLPCMIDPHVFHLHRILPTLQSNRRCIYLARDGRDVAVSKYFKIANNHTQLSARKEFQQWSGEIIQPNYIKEQLPVFIEWMFSEKHSSAINWSSHIEKGFEKNITYVKFESLKMNPAGALEKLFREIDSMSAVDQEKLENVIELRKIDNVRTRDNQTHKRKGITGEWKTYFTLQSRKTFSKYGQIALELAGYEKDKIWMTNPH